MNGKFHLKLNCIIIIVALLMCACFFVACNHDDEPYNPYAGDNNFEVIITDGDDALEFAPKDFTPTFGLIFYEGTLVDATNYTYLGEALARQGYLVVIPKMRNTLDFNNYNPNISALSKYPDVKFFIGGHDAGGGLAVRHAMDYAKYNYNMSGIILYAPIGFSKPVYENGEAVCDDDGVPVWEQFSTAEVPIYTLLIEVDDDLRTDSLKQTVQEHINTSKTTLYTLTDSKSAYFNTAGASSLTNENAIAQRNSTVEYTLAFMREMVRLTFAGII